MRGTIYATLSPVSESIYYYYYYYLFFYHRYNLLVLLLFIYLLLLFSIYYYMLLKRTVEYAKWHIKIQEEAQNRIMYQPIGVASYGALGHVPPQLPTV